jgi:GNAT superfamily N-acetyltransferase
MAIVGPGIDTRPEAIADIEDAFVGHWSVFGRWARGSLHDEQGILWFETPIRHLPYNGVIRTRIESDAEAAVPALVELFRSRGVDFLWLVHPSASPRNLGDLLALNGLRPVEDVTGMTLELAGWTAPELPAGVEYREVLDDDLTAFHELTVRYWELAEDDAALVAEFQREWGPGRAPGHRYLALVDETPVGKGYLSLAAPPGVAAIYAMYVAPEARGRGVAGGLTTTLIRRAQELGCRRLVLHATEMAVGVYARAGFAEHCRLTVFATAPVWSSAG